MDTLDIVIEKLKKSTCKKSSFYVTLEDGRLTVGWIEEQPDEHKIRRERFLNIGENCTVANVKQSIEAS